MIIVSTALANVKIANQYRVIRTYYVSNFQTQLLYSESKLFFIKFMIRALRFPSSRFNIKSVIHTVEINDDFDIASRVKKFV